MHSHLMLPPSLLLDKVSLCECSVHFVQSSSRPHVGWVTEEMSAVDSAILA